MKITLLTSGILKKYHNNSFRSRFDNCRGIFIGIFRSGKWEGLSKYIIDKLVMLNLNIQNLRAQQGYDNGTNMPGKMTDTKHSLI